MRWLLFSIALLLLLALTGLFAAGSGWLGTRLGG
jgi:hypothetical protein